MILSEGKWSRMICERCGCKNECSYYDTNIEPVLSTDYIFSSDNYLLALKNALDEYQCNYFESEDK